MIPGIVPIQLTRVQAHLILEPELTLIDCGLAGSLPRIRRAIEDHDRSFDDLARVICTHGHPDHAGSAKELAAAGVAVLIHPDDARNLATTWGDVVRRPSRGRFFAAMTPIPSETRPLQDGEVLPVLGGLQVIHTPGHTPGSVCLYGARDRVLFVGDALEARSGRVTFASRLYSDDVASARRQVQRLARLDIETIIFSHYPALERDAGAVLEGLAASI